MIDPNDLRIDYFRTPDQRGLFFSPKGVIITHLPSGRTFECSIMRSVHLNKASAFKMLENFLENRKMVDKVVLDRDGTIGNCSFMVEFDDKGGFYLDTIFDDEENPEFEEPTHFDHKEAKSLYEFLKTRFGES